MPGAGGLRLISGPVGPGTYPGLGWPSSGPKTLQPRWYKAGANKCSLAPSPDQDLPRSQIQAVFSPCRPTTKGPARCGPQQQMCVKAMWRPADCSVLNQLTSLLLAQTCPSHSLAQTTLPGGAQCT